MNLSETFDVPFVPSQTAQPEGGTMDTLPSAPRLNAEGGGNQAITVLAGVSGVSAPDVAIIMTSALKSPARRVVCLHGTSADVMAITEGSIVFAPKTPRIPETDHSDAQRRQVRSVGSVFTPPAAQITAAVDPNHHRLPCLGVQRTGAWGA